jgi:hypothetical protein
MAERPRIRLPPSGVGRGRLAAKRVASLVGSESVRAR